MSAQGFVDTFSQDYQTQDIPKDWTSIDSIWGKIGSGLGFVDRNEYTKWLSDQDKAYERASINSARAWEEWFDSTATQRRVKDIEAAGLNPWLALQSGGISANGSASGSAGGSARYKATSDSKSALSSIAMFLLATAKLFATLG